MAINRTSNHFFPLSDENRKTLEDLKQVFDVEADHFLGYPCNREFDYSPLYTFLRYPMNNVGDPYEPSNFHLNSHELEKDVLSFYGQLVDAPPEDTWGYITNGGTEGNMYGTYLAREMFPEGMVYYSEDTHYSVAKILRMVHAKSIMIKSQSNGEIDYQDLAETINIHRDVPPIIFANIGTTMKGAVDNINKIHEIMHDRAIINYYIHADAALSGMILPFVKEPQAFRFSDGIDSISISGHKMVGSPIPCGIVLAKKKHVDRISRSVEYIGSYDTTISGSRNGISPIFLWYAIQTRGIEGFKNIVKDCIAMADYAIEKFRQAGIHAWRNENSITVVFPRIAHNALLHWQIAVHKDYAHLITMPHVERRHIDKILYDILEDCNQESTASVTDQQVSNT